MSNRQDRLPVQVDPFRMAEARRILEGDVPLRQMKRLGALLESDAGAAHVRLEFGIDEMGARFLRAAITAALSIQCQRCLEPMPFDVDLELSLGLLHPGEEEAKAGVHEPLIVDEVPMHLTDLLEDEILLALPQIPRHALEACPARAYVEPAPETKEMPQGETDNPFAVLAKMKTAAPNEE